MTGADLGLDLRTFPSPNPNQSPSAPTTNANANANAMLGQKESALWDPVPIRHGIRVRLGVLPRVPVHDRRVHNHRRRTVDEPLEPVLRPVPVPALERADLDEAPPVTPVVLRAVVPLLHRLLPPLALLRDRVDIARQLARPLVDDLDDPVFARAAATAEHDEGEAVRAHGEEAAGELVHRGGVHEFGEDGGELRTGLEDEGVVLGRVSEYVEYRHTI
ncbi:hypothetical protein B0H14DRAFT_2880138 [Mycena olivaceomarginata]|nr:hypothetical protein B0H14DRAFT_2880138 [Mycena olivaceomarginata]